MTKATAILLNRATNQNKAFRPKQLLSFDTETVTVNIAKDDAYIYRHIQKAGRMIDQLGIAHPTLSGDWSFDEQWAFQLGFARFKNPGTLKLAPMPAEAIKEFEALSAIWNWVRTQINLGPSQCSPSILAKNTVNFIKAFGKGYTLKVEMIEGEKLKKQGFIGCYAVGRGSEFPPVLLSIKIYPKGQEKEKIKGCLIGKGITFDSGGYILKARDSGIGYMKYDMSGAATVAGAMAFSLFKGLSHPAQIILCCAENLVSSKAYRPGDVLTYKNGLSVEIINTDAEGRVVLADGFLKAQEENPKLIIDAATLTGAAKVAVGNDYAALFSMNEALTNRALKTAKHCHEGLWALPLESWHQEAYPSLVADTMNADLGASAAPAAASAAAGFLSRFVDVSTQKWLHYDLANAYTPSPNAMWPGGATGLMIRSIAATFQDELTA